MELWGRLTSITDVLLDPAAVPGSRRDAANDLAAFFGELAPIDEDDLDGPDHQDSLLATGRAIGALDAARCITDYQRTCTFLTGVDRAVRDSIERRGHAHVLYAGTGPYAPLLVPLFTRFTSDQLRVTCIDVHTESTERLATVVRALDAAPYINAIHRTDATTFDVPSEPAVDIVVTETLQRALTREPHVSIVRHLLAQLPDTVVMVPERITVTMSLAISGDRDAAVERDPSRRVELGNVLTLDVDTARAMPAGATIPCTRVVLPAEPMPGQALTFDTYITVAPGVELQPYDSGLTMPHAVHDTPVMLAGDQIVVDYVIDTDPWYRVEVTPAPVDGEPKCHPGSHPGSGTT